MGWNICWNMLNVKNHGTSWNHGTQTSLMATIPLIPWCPDSKKTRWSLSIRLYGLSCGFSRDGFIQTYPIPSNEKNNQPPVPYKSRHNWCFFLRKKLHFQTQTIGESKSLMINQLILIIPRKNIIVLPIVDGWVLQYHHLKTMWKTTIWPL